MIGCLPTQTLAFLAVFVYATQATQAIAFEWKPGLTLTHCLLSLPFSFHCIFLHNIVQLFFRVFRFLLVWVICNLHFTMHTVSSWAIEWLALTLVRSVYNIILLWSECRPTGAVCVLYCIRSTVTLVTNEWSYLSEQKQHSIETELRKIQSVDRTLRKAIRPLTEAR